jgi:alpha-D-ribose 1-methylphosphonate 5-triphosphate synthase subunit PhnG
VRDTVATEALGVSILSHPQDASTRVLSTDQLYEALARANDEELVALADRVLETPSTVTLIAGPTVVSSPLRLEVPGGAGTVVIGHVAMTTCEISLDGVRGDGIRSGRSLDACVAAAVCDAEVERGGPLSDDVFELANATLRRLQGAERQRARATQLTRLGSE